MNNYRTILLTFALVLTTTGCTSLQTDPNGPAPVSNAVRKEIGRLPPAPSKPSVSLTAKGARWLCRFICRAPQQKAAGQIRVVFKPYRPGAAVPVADVVMKQYSQIIAELRPRQRTLNNKVIRTQ